MTPAVDAHQHFWELSRPFRYEWLDAPGLSKIRRDYLPEHLELQAALECFGPGRLMFGSDWPVCELAASYGQVRQALVDALGPISETERSAIFGGSAALFYGLPGGSVPVGVGRDLPEPEELGEFAGVHGLDDHVPEVAGPLPEDVFPRRR
jgi:predicted TIM-barrel fold metal-dependent hydrolase